MIIGMKISDLDATCIVCSTRTVGDNKHTTFVEGGFTGRPGFLEKDNVSVVR